MGKREDYDAKYLGEERIVVPNDNEDDGLEEELIPCEAVTPEEELDDGLDF